MTFPGSVSTSVQNVDTIHQVNPFTVTQQALPRTSQQQWTEDTRFRHTIRKTRHCTRAKWRIVTRQTEETQQDMPLHQTVYPPSSDSSCSTMLYTRAPLLPWVSPLMGMREGDAGRPWWRLGFELYKGSRESLGDDTLFLFTLESPDDGLQMLLFTCTLLP